MVDLLLVLGRDDTNGFLMSEFPILVRRRALECRNSRLCCSRGRATGCGLDEWFIEVMIGEIFLEFVIHFLSTGTECPGHVVILVEATTPMITFHPLVTLGSFP